MKRKPVIVSLIVFCALSFFSHGAMAADVGVDKDTIKIGSSMILTGPAAFWGQGSDKGARAYFEHINEQGGIHGRKIEFINTDNRWEPATAVANVKKLVHRDQVFVLMGIQGSPNILAAEKVFANEGVPLIAPICTGDELVNPLRKYVFVVFTQYSDQARALVQYMAQDAKWKSSKFAVIYQNDIIGKDGLAGLRDQVQNHPEMKLVGSEHFERGATDFSSQVLKCRESGADALLLSCAVSQAAMIMKEAEKLDWNPQFMVLSGAADQKLVELAGTAAEGLLAGTNALLPTEKDSPEVKKVTQIVHKYYPKQEINVPAVDGVAVAMITVEALTKAGPDPTRKKVMEALEGMKNFETGLIPPVTFGPDIRQGTNGIFLYQVQQGKFKLIESID